MGLKEDYEKQLMDMWKKSQGDGEKQDNFGIVCPTYYGKKCRVCDYCKEILFDKAKYDGTPIQQAARDKNIKHHFYSNIVFATDPNEIVVFDYGSMIHDKLLGYQMDPMSQFKFFFDPQTGRNLYLIKIPGETKRKTKYDVEPIIKSTPFPNMRLLGKLDSPEYQLHNIVELIKTGKVKVLTQGKLPAQRTELRFLPSWLGPDSFVFSHHVMYHYGLSQDEFTAVQEGRLDPFAEFRNGGQPKEEAPPVTIMTSPTSTGTQSSTSKPGGWGSFAEVVSAPTPTAQPAAKKEEVPAGRPRCFGTFDVNNTECTEECMEDGWGKPCQAVKEAEAGVEKRRAAKRAL